MALTYWRDDFKTHHPQIDSEHQEILNILNCLYQDILLSVSNTIIRITLDELFGCLLNHSETEESLMRQYDYPDIRSHIDDHEVILSKIFNLRLRVEFHELQATTELVHDIANCINVHNRTYDLNMIQYIQSQDQDSSYLVNIDELGDLTFESMF